MRGSLFGGLIGLDIALKWIKNAYCSFLQCLSAHCRPCPLPHLTVLVVSTEQKWSEWLLSWKVRWNWLFSPQYLLAAFRLETSVNLFWEHRIIFGDADSPSFLHFPPLSPGVFICSNWLSGVAPMGQTVVRHRENKASPIEIRLIELNYFMRWHALTRNDLF